MTLILKSNSRVLNSLGNRNGMGDLQDFRFLIDFEGELATIVDGSDVYSLSIPEVVKVTRASEALYNYKGVEKLATPNTPRIHTMKNGDSGLLIEPVRTNYLSNPNSPVTQTVTIPSAGIVSGVVLSIDGTGSATMSGDITELSDISAKQGVPIGAKLVNPGSGSSSITVTITGDVTRFQLEKAAASQGGLFQSTFVNGTRAAEFVELMPSIATKMATPEFTVLMSYTLHNLLGKIGGTKILHGISDSTKPKGGISTIFSYDYTTISSLIIKENTTPIAETINYAHSSSALRNTAVIAHDGNSTITAINGLSKKSASGHIIGLPNKMEIGSKTFYNSQDGQLGGVIRKIAVFNRKLTDAEINQASVLFL